MDNNSTQNATNTTKDDVEMGFQEPMFHLTYDTSLIVVSFLVILTNATVLFLFAHKPRLRTKTNCLLASLAVSDLGMGLFGIPIFISCNATYNPALCLASAVSYRFVAVSTMFHIFAVTVERYISIIHPMRYMSIINRTRVYRVIGVIWVFSLLFPMIQLTWVNASRIVASATESIKLNNLVYHSFGAVVCFAVPFLVMTFIYGQMFIVIHRQVVEIRKQHIATESKAFSPIYTELRAISVFAAMLGIFAFCWITWYISIFDLYLELDIPIFNTEVVWMICDFLRFSTSLINPVLYTYLKYDFKKALNSVLCSRRRRKFYNSVVTKSPTTQICETQCSMFDPCGDTKC